MKGWGLGKLAPGRLGSGKLAPGKGWGPASLAPGWDGASQAGAREGLMADWAGARGRDRPSRPRPGQAVAVAETALGCWSGGSVAGVARERDGIGTEGSREWDVVTKSVRTPLFRACCPTVTDALHELTPP